MARRIAPASCCSSRARARRAGATNRYRVLGRANDLRHLTRMLGENVVHGGLDFARVEKNEMEAFDCGSRSMRSVFFFLKSECGSEIDGSSGLSDAALLIGN